MGAPVRNPERCVDCGAAPAPHWFLFIDSTINIFFGRALRVVVKPFLILLAPLTIRLTNIVTHLILQAFVLAGAGRYETGYAPSHPDRRSVIFAEAKARSIRIESLVLFGKKMVQTRAWLPLSRGSQAHGWWYFEHLPIPPWLEVTGAIDIDNKEEFKKLFRKHGLKVAVGKPVLTTYGAKRVLRTTTSGSVIVKPLDGSRARHTRVNVRTESELVSAVQATRRICPMVMVEEYIPGIVHRATCIGGQLVGVIKFARPTMTADGSMTARAMKDVWNAKLVTDDVQPLEENALFVATLAHQGYMPESVPEKGAVVTLAEFSERVNGGLNIDVTDTVPETTKARIEEAARTTKLSVVGFDIITKDITDANEPITFLEANTAPFVEIHHFPTIGTPRNVAAKIFDLWS